MNGEILSFLITYILCFVVMTIWIYTKLKRPFTLADLLFFPDEKCIKKFYDVDDVHGISIIKWIPGVNLIVCGIILVLMFICYVTILLEWLYDNTLKRMFSKIIFK